MKNITTYETAMCGIMTALMCIAGPLAVPIGPIPVTLIGLVLFFALMVTGTKLTMISFIAYLLLGAAGLPVFSGYAGGAAKLAGPTGGYLIGFLFMIPIAGAFRRRYADRPVLTGCGMLLGLAAAYFFGTAWFVYQMHVSVRYALSVCVLPFIPFDLIKIVLAVLAGGAVRKALLRAGIGCE